MFNIIYKSITIIIFLSISLHSQDFDLYDLHFVQSVGKDTVYFQSLKKGGFYTFILKSSNYIKILSDYDFTESDKINFIIDDFDNDGYNEVLTIDWSEAYYSFRLYKIDEQIGGIYVKTVYGKNNFYYPMEDIPGTKFGIIKIYGSNPKIIVFYTTIWAKITSSFILFYDKLRKRYQGYAATDDGY